MLLLSLLLVPSLAAAAPLELKPTDRVVLIGGTMIEREQRHGHWEAVLTAQVPGIKVRNLGWSGDDVFGTARRAFEIKDENIGRKRLVELAVAEKPTVIVIAYGGNEAFSGDAGLPAFKAGYEKLLEELAPTKARIVLVSPPPLERKGPPLPDPDAQNKRLVVYRDAIKEIAQKRSLAFADLFQVMTEQSGKRNLTDDGLQLHDDGYKQTARDFATSLGFPTAVGYADTMEPMREAIVRKNQLYFYAWRPQNETYLTGFRKHEQGRNAKEVAEFNPLVAAVEAEIEALNSKKN